METLSQERKRLQAEGLLPDWFTTNSWQMVKKKYLSKGESYRDRISTIAKTLAQYTPNPTEWEQKFFDMCWKGWVSLSTPVLSNVGTTKGLGVSCMGMVVEDNLDSIYKAKHEIAMLTKAGFGTSGDLSNIRQRGALVNGSFSSSGVVPVMQGFISDMQYLHQGSARRGSFASYIDIEHGDFDEIISLLKVSPDDANIGWVIKQTFIDKLDAGCEEATRRFQVSLATKMVTGKGYYWLIDKVNEALPEVFKNLGMTNKSGGLCVEITLIADENHSYSCILSSMNLTKYNEWKGTDAIFNATVLLDCVCEDFLRNARFIPGLEKVVRFTEKFRALGLGVLGWHTYLQNNMISLGSLEAVYLNTEIFKAMQEESLRASKWLAEVNGQSPEMSCTDRANSNLLAIAPTMSTALIMGGCSQGIEPIAANVYTQGSAAGEVYRVNPALLDLLKSKDKYSEEVLKSIEEAQGSVQHLGFLSDEEKLVFRTGFEIDQLVLLRLASQRQQYLCQGQSLNLFFASDVTEEEVAKVHKYAFKDPRILGLYYVRTMRGAAPKVSCEGCAG